MEDLLDKLLQTVEMGKVSSKSSYPGNLKGQDGAFELTKKAVEDLTEIWNYTSENWSEHQADKYYQLTDKLPIHCRGYNR